MGTANMIKMANRLYVGRKAGAPAEVFRSATEPTHTTHGERFAYVIGPFRTRRGADWMADNHHCRCVADAERLAKKYATTGKKAAQV